MSLLARANLRQISRFSARNPSISLVLERQPARRRPKGHSLRYRAAVPRPNAPGPISSLRNSQRRGVSYTSSRWASELAAFYRLRRDRRFGRFGYLCPYCRMASSIVAKLIPQRWAISAGSSPRPHSRAMASSGSRAPLTTRMTSGCVAAILLISISSLFARFTFRPPVVNMTKA